MIQTIKLNKLRLSPINVRTAPDEQLQIEPMAASIEAKGVLQNLLVTPAKKPRGTFEVFDGGRRWRALRLLAERGTISETDFDVPVMVLTGDDAELSETSTATNFHQLKMTPAEECRAFQHFIGTTGDIDAVAKRFGVTRRFVEGRLRLASLAEPIFEALSKGAITLDIAKAYRGVSYDEAAKRVFHHEGRRAMRRLAEALELDPASYDVRSDKGGVAISGDITLHGEEVWVRLSLGSFGPDHEVAFRRVRGRDDHCGDRNRWASINELLAPDSFADRLRRELRLAPPRVAALSTADRFSRVRR